MCHQLLRRVPRQPRPPTTTSTTTPTKVLRPVGRFCPSAGANRTPTTPNPDAPTRIDVEAVDGGSVSVEADRCVPVWLTCPVPAICGVAVVPVNVEDRCVESGIGRPDLIVNGDQTTRFRDRRPADRHRRRRVAHGVPLNPHGPAFLCPDRPPTVFVIAGTSLTGTCSEVSQMALRRAQFTKSTGRYRRYDADRLNPDAYRELKVRLA